MPSDAPYFSIVVPCHDAAETLPEAVAGVLAQTDPDFELILIDDGSTDATRAVARALAATDPRIRVVAQSNRGVAAARNRGVSLARGEAVAFLDADDTRAPPKLARHRAVFAVSSTIGLSHAASASCAPTARPRRSPRPPCAGR